MIQKAKIVGEYEQTFSGLGLGSLAVILSEELTIKKEGIEAYKSSELYKHNNKVADDICRKVGEYKFNGKVPKEGKGELVAG